MQEVLRTAEKVAASDLSVIITGEHGTGKEWLARVIHRRSPRATERFYPVDCGALLPEEMDHELFGYEAVTQSGIVIRRGAFEEVGRGTLLLNDVDALPASVQMRVARALEYRTIHRTGNDRPIDVEARVIATTNRSADMLVLEGRLQKEMYYRISPIAITIPPLRDRREDIVPLIDAFVEEMNHHPGARMLSITPDALQLFLEYDWPGNVRRLKNAVEYAAVMSAGGEIQPEHLPDYMRYQVADRIPPRKLSLPKK